MKMPMAEVEIYGRDKDKSSVLDRLCQMEIMDITASCEKSAEYGKEIEEFLENSGLGEKALEIFERYSHEKKGIFDSLNGRTELTDSQYRSYEKKIPRTLEVCKSVIERSERILQAQEQIKQLQSEIEQLMPWTLLDIDLAKKETSSVRCKIGIVNKGFDIPDGLPLYIETASSTKKEQYLFVMYSKKASDECEGALRSIGFKEQIITEYGTPNSAILNKRKQIQELEGEIRSCCESICDKSAYRREIQFITDYFRVKSEKAKTAELVAKDGRLFIIKGYIPKYRARDVKQILERDFAVAVQITQADDDAPVVLLNSQFAEPAESVVSTFALPDSYEIDPTAIMSVFYYIFFGLMLSDAAYGAIIAVVCLILLRKFKNMDSGMRKNLRLFMYCGVSAIFWGVMFGSYFGDAVSVISSVFFGKEITIPPLWFEPVSDPMRMLMFSFLLGIIHLFTGLGINLYLSLRAKNYIGAFNDGIFWYMLVGGGIVYLFGVDMFTEIAGLKSKLNPPYTTIAIIVAIAGALGIVLFSSTSKNALKRLGKGAYSLYGVTGWLSDILSYSRLLALGLATSVIATVFNKMGTMLGGGILGLIVFIIVFILGHTLNIGVNLLGAYVHTNRLQYVEFFGKFYEGGGRAFRPFGTKTKYFKMKGQ